MNRTRQARPKIEVLEARDCPAVTLKYLPTALILTGRPTGALSIEGQASGLFKVSDGGKSLGNYALNRDLIIRLSSRPGDLEIDLNGKSLGGNVLIDLGNGYTGPASASVSADLFDKTNSGASVRGSVTILKGNGRELIGLGGNTDGGGAFVTGAVTVRGNVTVAAKASGGSQDNFQAGENTRILGNLTMSQVDRVLLGNQVLGGVTVSKNVSITTVGGSLGTVVTMAGNFGGNVSVNGLATATGFNAFSLQPPSVAADTSVGGNLSVTFGQAVFGNTYQVLAAVGNPVTSRVDGNVTFTSRNALAGPLSDAYLVQGVVAGSLYVNLGYGDSDVSFENAFASVPAEVSGNVIVQGQSGGTTNIGVNNGNVFDGSIGGNVSIFLGNGTNNVTLTSSVPGKLTYRGGNGSDTLEIAGAGLYRVDVLFGTGTNTLTLNAAMALTGLVKSTSVTNFFNQNMADLLSTLVFVNLP